MATGIQFPTDAAVIVEEVARFRAMSPEDRIRVIRDLITAGATIVGNSPKADFLRAYTQQQEAAGKRAIQDFISRHGS